MSSRPTPDAGSGPPVDLPIVWAKVGVPPSRLDMVSRSRLLDRMDDRPARVFLISAPAGSGKTVLVQGWLQRCGAPAAWLSLDALDNEPSRFFAHLGAALQQVGLPGLTEAGKAADRVSRTGGDPGHAFLPAFGQAEEDAVLVLDDCQVLEEPFLGAFLESLVTSLQSGPRLVLLSRVDPPLPLSRIRLSGELLEIRQRDLRFRGEEVSEFFGKALSFQLPPGVAELLEEKTEGWAAGLRMAAIALQHAPDPGKAADAFAGSHELLADYLLEEAVGRQDPSLQRFLLETSVLPRFNEEACVAVTGDPGAGDHLRAVDEANLFLVSLDQRQRWYRYHHLFAELLQFRLQTTQPERVEGLRERASLWFESRGEIQEALTQAAEMENRRRLLELLDAHGYQILARSEFASFSRWLKSVPDPLSQPYPMVLAALAWFRAQTERAPDLENLLGALEDILEAPPVGYPPHRLVEARRHLGALRAFGYRITSRFQEALETGELVLAQLPPDAVTIRGILQFNMGAVQLRLANMTLAKAALEQGYESCLKTNLPYLVLASLGHLGNVTANLEGLSAARRHLESAVAFAQEQGLAGVPAFAIILYQLGQVHYLAHELENARIQLERGLKLTQGERETDIHANVLIHLARVAVAQGEFAEAEAHLTAASALAFSYNVKPYSTTLDVEWARLNEARTGRLQPPETAPPSAEPSGIWTTWVEAETILQLQHCLQLGRQKEGARLATLLRAESEPRKRGIALCVAGLAEAALAPDAATRKERLISSVSLAAERGYVMPLIQGGPPLRALLEAGLKYPLPSKAQAFVRDRVLPLVPRATPADAFPLPSDAEDWDLTEKEMEVLPLLARGMTNAEMARKLFVSVNTVKTHLKHVFTKLDAANRTEAVQRARSRGLLSSDDR